MVCIVMDYFPITVKITEKARTYSNTEANRLLNLGKLIIVNRKFGPNTQQKYVCKFYRFLIDQFSQISVSKQGLLPLKS